MPTTQRGAMIPSFFYSHSSSYISSSFRSCNAMKFQAVLQGRSPFAPRDRGSLLLQCGWRIPHNCGNTYPHNLSPVRTQTVLQGGEDQFVPHVVGVRCYRSTTSSMSFFRSCSYHYILLYQTKSMTLRFASSTFFMSNSM